MFDVNRIQNKLNAYCQERKLGDLGIFENIESLEITLLTLNVKKRRIRRCQ